MIADKTLRVPSRVEPTFWNRDITLGAAIGFLAGFIPPLAPLAGLAVIAGGIIGGFMGKRRMEQEAMHGKDVNPPSFWNRTTVTGAALGTIVAGIIGAAVIIGKMPAGLTAAETQTFFQTSVRTMAGSLLATNMIGLTVGGLIGGNLGKSRMEHEYWEAQAYVTRNGQYKGRAAEAALAVSEPQPQQPQQTYTVTPEEARLLEERLSRVESKVGTHANRVRDPANVQATNVSVNTNPPVG